MKVLVTGSSGHLAKYVIPLLERRDHEVVPFDLPECDVGELYSLANEAKNGAEFCIHLAGLKYADRAELEPADTVDTNVFGTENVAVVFGPNCVMASTCKAADPETIYGASKMIGERIVLSHGGRVVRFVNVMGSAGSVTDIWAALPPDEALPVCDAVRLFMSPEEAALLIVTAMDWPTGRYAPRDPMRSHMRGVAEMLYPKRPVRFIPLRRGDRRTERLLAACEYAVDWESGAIKIFCPHDPEEEL